MPVFDGAASILIGLTLCTVALILLRETKGLLLGEAVLPEMLASLRALMAEDPAVHAVGRVLTMHMAPSQVLVNAELEFRPSISGAELIAAVRRIEQRLREAHQEVSNVFIEPMAAQNPAAAPRPSTRRPRAGG
jgi:divalent metal cation (Fe/Co/Zn/Cd) transporter